MNEYSSSVVPIIFVCLFLIGNVARAQQPIVPVERSPLQAVRAAQDLRHDTTLRSIDTALNPEIPIEGRQHALSLLGGVEFDYVLANSDTLLRSDSQLAVQTITMISAEIAMLPSMNSVDDVVLDELSAYQHSLVRRSEAALIGALDHPDPEVRVEASIVLASRGRATALVAIDSMIQSGELDARQGVGYLSLAPNQIASPFVERYALQGAEEVRAAAIAQLAYNPSYIDRVRGIALNPLTPALVTSAALPGLAKTDVEFLQYGPALANNSEVPVTVREVALRESLSTLTLRPSSFSDIDGVVARALRETSLEINSAAAIEAYSAFESRSLIIER